MTSRNGWIKYFTDGSRQVGSDILVNASMSSWSKGRLSDIASVELSHEDHILLISGIGTYWQSDDFEVGFLESNPTLVTRRLQYKVSEDDEILVLVDDIGLYRHFKFTSRLGSKATRGSHRWDMTKHIGEWFTLEIDLKKNISFYYFSKERI